MKVYSKIVWNWDETELVEIESESYEYSGPIVSLDGGGGGGPSIPTPRPGGGADLSGITGAIDNFFGTNIFGGLSNEDITAPLSQLFPPSVDVPTLDVPDFEQEQEATDYSNIISNDAPIKVVYGQRMLGGHVVHIETSSDNKYLYVWYVLCEGEIESIEDVIVNGVYYRKNGTIQSHLAITDENATQDDFIKAHTVQYQTGDGAPFSLFNSKYGTDDQLHATLNLEANSQWTSYHRGAGLVVVPMQFEWNRETWTQIPKVKFVVKGKKVFDFRTQSYAYSTNPVLHLWDYLIDSRYGCGIPNDEIDGATKYQEFLNDTTSSFAVAADLCDTTIALYGATTGKFWEGNSVIDTSKSLIHNVKKLLGAFAGHLTWEQGEYKLVVETTGSSTAFSFTEDHIIGGVALEGEAKRNRFNRVHANFINALDNYERDEVCWPEYGSGTYLEEDNNFPLETTLNLGCITDPYRAQNMCARMVLRSRIGKTISFTVTSEGFNVRSGDLIAVTYTSLGFSAKVFRVMQMTLNIDGTIQIVAKEHDDAIYDTYTYSEYSASPLSNLPNPLATTPPTNITVSESLFEVIQSAGVHNRITIDWDPSLNLFTDEYEWQYKKSSESDSEYKLGGFTRNTEAFVDDLENVEYTFRVRAINASGSKSSFISTTHNVIGLQAIPADVTEFSANVLDGNVYLTWGKPTDLDVKIAGKLIIKFQDVTSGASWTNGRLISPEGFAPNDTIAITQFVKSGTYMAKWEDSTGNRSANSVSSIVFSATVQHLNSVTDDTVSPAFTGTYTNTLVSDSKLKLSGKDVTFGGTDLTSGDELTGATTSLTEIVHGTNNDSELTVSGDITFAGVNLLEQHLIVGLRNGETYSSIDQQNTSGSFISDYFDLGATYSARITSIINFLFSQTSTRDTIDNLASEAKIDDITDFDSLTYGVDDINVQTYVRTTNDNPASSPTWTNWERFVTGDFSARAYQWKIEIESGDTFHQVNISEFKVLIDLPDLTKSGSGTSSASADTTVTFVATPRFYSTPNVGITVSNMNSGDYYAITSKTNTGFVFNAYNSGGSRVARNFEYIAKGF